MFAQVEFEKTLRICDRSCYIRCLALAFWEGSLYHPAIYHPILGGASNSSDINGKWAGLLSASFPCPLLVCSNNLKSVSDLLGKFSFDKWLEVCIDLLYVLWHGRMGLQCRSSSEMLTSVAVFYQEELYILMFPSKSNLSFTLLFNYKPIAFWYPTQH